MLTREYIWELAEHFLSGTDKFVTDVTVKKGNVITIVIDGDTAVMIDDCVNLSKSVEAALDRNREDFELTVTSYGADKPLQFPRQYRKNIGRTLKIATRDQQNIQGKLTGVSEKFITVEITEKKKSAKIKEIEPNVLQIPFDSIALARVVISFSSKAE